MAKLFLISFFAAMVTGMFVINHQVIALENNLDRINAKIREDQNALHVLKAEWTHLNDPARIRHLSENHIHMKPVRGEQIISFSAIPFKSDNNGKGKVIRVSYASASGR